MSRTPFSTRLLAAGIANFQETTLQLRSSHAMTIVMDDNLSVRNFDVHQLRIGIPRISDDLGHNCRGTAIETDPQMIKDVKINRSEERRVGNEGVIKCRSRWTPYH